jgi:deazaflavin-dependent oxidoreductase (nitroreductase family)
MNTKDRIGIFLNAIHRNVFLATNGRVFGKLMGMPALMLTTTGRKTGKKRQSMLTTPIHDDERIVIVASWGGDDRHPKWYLNLRENPDVEVVIDGKKRDMRARVATTEEKAELWPQVVGTYKGYGQYQTRTSREIPLVILAPRP